MVVAVLVVVFSTQALWGLLEGIAAGVVVTDVFGALLGFEATCLLTGIILCGWLWLGLGVSVFVLCLLHAVLEGLALMAGLRECGVGVWGCCLGTV